MTILQDGAGGYLTLLVAGALANEVWRWMGLVAGSRLDLNGRSFQWVRAVALALVAGLVSRMVLFPSGALGNVPVAVRIGAFAAGLVLFFALRRNLAAGVVGGALLLLAAEALD